MENNMTPLSLNDRSKFSCSKKVPCFNECFRDLNQLLRRTGTIEDVVKAVIFIIKDAPFITGSVLRLDGGYVLGGDKVAPIPKGVL